MHFNIDTSNSWQRSRLILRQDLKQKSAVAHKEYALDLLFLPTTRKREVVGVVVVAVAVVVVVVVAVVVVTHGVEPFLGATARQSQ